MNILIYTKENTSAFNNFNINYLIRTCPSFNFLFVIIKKQKKPFSITKIKSLVYTLINEKNHLKYDNKLLERKINSKSPFINFNDFPHYYVDTVNSLKTQKLLYDLNPDIIFQAGAGILKKNIFSIAKIATINVHHGLAPEIRGIQSTFWCLYYGLTDYIGVTCHIIDENIDTGNIISRYNLDYDENYSFIDIQYKLCIEGAKLLVQSIELLSKNNNLSKSTEEVKSFYFSNLDYKEYNKLKKNNFKKIKSSQDLNYKIKHKTILS